MAAAAVSGNLDRAARQAALAGEVLRWDAERAAQADLLRDIFGNPFLAAPVIDPTGVSRRGGGVAELARDIYDARAFDRLPSLADVLEAGGGGHPTLTAHLRAPGPHVRGCWALDWLR